jgi:hypothetical protein
MSSLLICSEAPKGIAEHSWSRVLAFVAPQIQSASSRISSQVGVSRRDLAKQLLLHLPRLSSDELLDPEQITREAERLAEMLLNDRRGFEFWAGQPKVQVFHKADANVQPCESDIAQGIHERFHYIRSYHPGLVDLALYLRCCPEIPVALASISSMDIKHLDGLFPGPEERARVLVLTRLFAFDWAPRNSVSYLLGQVCRWTKRNFPKVTTLLTYVNSNLGFSGSSFYAANWRPFVEKTVSYCYFRDTYITARTLRSLSISERGQVKHSLYELEPLRLLRYDITE